MALIQRESNNQFGDIVINNQILFVDWELQQDNLTNAFEIQNNGINAITILNTSRNVGIGTETPASKLDVNGNINGSSMSLLGDLTITSADPFINIDNTDETDGGIRFRDSQDLAGQNFEILFDSDLRDLKFKNADIDNILYLDVLGNIGLRTASPSELLHLNSTTGNNCNIQLTIADDDDEMRIKFNKPFRNWSIGLDTGGSQFNFFDVTDNNVMISLIGGSSNDRIGFRKSAPSSLYEFDFGGDINVDGELNLSTQGGVLQSQLLAIDGNSTFFSYNAVINAGHSSFTSRNVGFNCVQTVDNEKLFFSSHSGTAVGSDIGTLNTFDNVHHLVLNSGGNVAIGVSTASSLLHLESASPLITIDNTAETDGGIRFRDADDGNQIFRLLFNSQTTDLRFESFDADNIIYMQQGGNVGIGTDSPQSILHLSRPSADGSVGIVITADPQNTNEDANPFITMKQDGTAVRMTTGIIGETIPFTGGLTNQGYINMETNFGLQFGTNNTARMIIENTGDVGIGITNPTVLLELGLNEAKKPTSSTWTITSDKRLKENIVNADLDRCYDDIKSLSLKKFKWKDSFLTKFKESDKNSLGFIADDVKNVFPKSVKVRRNIDLNNENRKKNPDSIDRMNNLLSIDYHQINMSLFGTVKLLIQKIETLETRILSLESN